MKVIIGKSRIAGQVTAPASKSYTIRGLICSALADGESEIINPLASDDTEAIRRVLSDIGVKIEQEANLWRVNGGILLKSERDLFCADSAATLRFMTAVCSTISGEFRLTAGPSLAKRPVAMLVEALKQLGVECSCQGTVVPVVVKGGGLKGGLVELPGDISSQFVSALLIVSPLAEREVYIRLTTPPRSKPYIQMTLDCMKKFGIRVSASDELREFNIEPQKYRPAKYRVEGDWSSASYFLAMGARLGKVTVNNLNTYSLQGDRMMLNLLRDMGASVETNESAVTASRSMLRSIRADLSDSIDLLPTIAVLTAIAEGTSELSGIARARIKESDRVLSIKKGLGKMGIVVDEEEDRMVLIGGKPKGAIIDSYNDHRIAMAFSIAGMVAGGTTINGAECVAKTYPDFWEVLRSIGGKARSYG
jgi:3-phosphoshikimate 1-carboxyvinyltransferase